MTTPSNPPGFYWHVHHDILLEWCYDYPGRVDYITREKHPSEVPLRMRLFQPVKGLLPGALGQAQQTYDQAQWQARTQAWQGFHQAQRAYHTEIQALHAQECPGCPWNGKTMFADPSAEGPVLPVEGLR